MKSKTQTDQLVILPEPHPGNDANVKLPDDVLHAAAVAEALISGSPVPPTPQSKQTGSRRIKYTVAQIDQVLQDWDKGALKPADPRFEIIIELAREGARHIKARRRGARQPRKKSDRVTRRLEALVQAYRGLSKKMQKTPTGETAAITHPTARSTG